MSNDDDTALEPFDLKGFLPFRLNRAAEKVSRSFQKIYRDDHGMTRPEWRVLANLGDSGQMTARQICDRASMHKTEVSRAVTRLQERRWLERAENPEDRREAFLVLTQTGRAAFAGLTRRAMEFDEAIFRRIGPDGTAALADALAALEDLETD